MVQARLATSLIIRSNSLGLQGSSAMPATYQSILNYEEGPKVVMNAIGIGTESGGTDRPGLLRTLLLKLTQLLSAFVTPLGYFEALSPFRPEEYTINDIGPQIICYSSILAEMNPTIAIMTQDLFVAKTPRHWTRIKLRTTVAVGTT